MKKNLLLIVSFLSLSIHETFSSDRKIKLSNTQYKNSDQSSSQSIKLDHFVGHLAVDLAWVWFSKRPCNKKLFKNTILPEGHNIFSTARTTGNVLDAPYIQTDTLYNNKTEDIRCVAIKGMMKIRDEAMFLGGKYLRESRYILSGSCVALSSLIESEILKKKKINNFFKRQSSSNLKIKNDDTIAEKYAKINPHTQLVEQSIDALNGARLNINSIAQINQRNNSSYTNHNVKYLL